MHLSNIEKGMRVFFTPSKRNLKHPQSYYAVVSRVTDKHVFVKRESDVKARGEDAVVAHAVHADKLLIADLEGTGNES